MLRPQEAIPAAIPAGNTPWKVPLLPMKLPKAQGITHHKCLTQKSHNLILQQGQMSKVSLPLGSSWHLQQRLPAISLIQSRVPNVPSIATRLQAGENIRQMFKVPAGPWQKTKQEVIGTLIGTCPDPSPCNLTLK